MMSLFLTVGVVSGALLVGAAWGIFGKLSDRVEGFLVALAGGALIISAVSELIEPSIEKAGLWIALLGVAGGAVVFALADWLVDEKWGSQKGGGLLASITLDGVPENLALGVALIGAGPTEVAALAGSILLSNLPEAAGGAKRMSGEGGSGARVFGLWSATALILSAAAIAGNLALEGASEATLGTIRCFAAGAVIGSLGTEVFPKAFREDRHMVAVATALGVILALGLGRLGGS